MRTINTLRYMLFVVFMIHEHSRTMNGIMSHVYFYIFAEDHSVAYCRVKYIIFPYLFMHEYFWILI